MYLIPKNIKVRREIFRGYGIKEVLLIGLSVIIGFILSKIFGKGILKVFYFTFLPILTFLITLPLPSGNSNVLCILIKIIKFEFSQKKYKKYIGYRI